MRPIRTLVVFGTRPEAIKMAPVVRTLGEDARFQLFVAVTAQHREMLDQALDVFEIRPDFDLDLMRHGQTLEEIVAGILHHLGPVIDEVRPEVVLVHGDTITTFAAALSAFFHRVPVAHVEAGLRSRDPYDPFPEEMDRRLTGVLSSLHFAPTAGARENLLRENVDPRTIFVTGNTVVDALLATIRPGYTFTDQRLARAAASGRRLLLVTTHRRENLGEPLERVYRALLRIVREVEDTEVVFAVHPNPAVRAVAHALLDGKERVTLVDPPGYREFVHLMQAATLVLTDSGGLQEEAPALGKPVLVLRETTERPEGIAAGTCVRVGTDEEEIVRVARRLLTDAQEYARMARAVNPYGDGRAAVRVREALVHALRGGPRPADFAPQGPRGEGPGREAGEPHAGETRCCKGIFDPL